MQLAIHAQTRQDAGRAYQIGPVSSQCALLSTSAHIEAAQTDSMKCKLSQVL